MPTQQRNEWFRENLLMPDDNTKYYRYRVVSHTDHTKDHFVLDHEPNLVDWTTEVPKCVGLDNRSAKVCWIMTRRVIFTISPAVSNDPLNAAGNGNSLEFMTV